MKLFIKYILLCIFMILCNLTFLDRIIAIGFKLGLLIYIFIWILSLISLIILSLQPFSFIKFIISFLISVSAMISTGYYFATSQYMEFYEFENLLNVINLTGDAIRTFDGIMWASVGGVIGLLALLLPSGIKQTKSFVLTVLPMVVVCLGIVVILFARNGEGSSGFPTQYSPIAYGMILGVEKLLSNNSSQLPHVEISAKSNAFDGDIIFIMDESIRGDFLDINSATGVETGLSKFQGKFINFGVASSMTNCSDSSNLSMRYGVSRDNYLDDIKQKPSMWQFANSAGFKTSYIDAQNTENRLCNHMSEFEKQSIDDFYQVSDDDTVLYEKDLVVADRIRQKLVNGVRDFIYVNKMGVHFPYEGKYPQHEKIYQPTMDETSFNKSFPKEGEVKWPSSGDELTRLKFVNSYKNAVHWNLKTFFNKLFIDPISDPYVIFYTSDHGQTFHDDGRPGYGTHCSITITDSEEGRVPFLVFTNSPLMEQQIKRSKNNNFNKISLFNLPATLYYTMGYSLSDLGNYEPSIFSPLDKRDQEFISKYFVRFGNKPIFNSIYEDFKKNLEKTNTSHR